MKLALAFTAALLTALAFWWFASNDASTPVAAAPTHTLTDAADLDAVSLQQPLESATAPTDAAERAALETARAEITESAAPEPALAEHPEFARFDLRVVSRDTGKPVPNHRVTLFPDGAAVWNGQPGRGNVALPGESARTNARGEATLFAAPSPEPFPGLASDAESLQGENSGSVQLESSAGGRPSRFVAVVGDPKNSPQTPVGPAIVSLDAFHADHRVALEPFGAGERRSVTLEVRVEPDRLVHGLVLDAWTREPLAGAAVWLDSEKAALSDENGAFFVAACSWEHKQFRVDHNDYLSARMPLELGFEDPSRPRTVLMLKRAELEVSVVDARGQFVEARVEARLPEGLVVPGIEHLNAKSWSMNARPERRADLFDLPAGVDLQLTASTPLGATVRQTVRTAAGVAPTQVTLRLPPAASITGVLRGVTPLAGQRIVMRRVSPTPSESELVRLDGVSLAEWSELTDVGLSAQTDSAGRFSFEQVAEGSWQLSCTHEKDRRLLARATVVVKAPEHYEVVLDPRAMASLRGVVLDSNGRAVPANVTATNAAGQFFEAGDTDERGRFEITGLEPGEYSVVAAYGGSAEELEARPDEDSEWFFPPIWIAESEINVSPGENVVELRLREARSLAFVLHDPSGAPLEGSLECTRPDGHRAEVEPEDGVFAFVAELGRGPVKVRARSSDGRFVGERTIDPDTWTSSTPQTWRLERVAPPDKR
jgi:hypothetical protein